MVLPGGPGGSWQRWWWNETKSPWRLFFAGAFVERRARQLCRNVRIWDRTSPPTSHFRTRFGSNMRLNFGLYVRIRIGHGPNFGPISVRIGIGHVPALSSVLSGNLNIAHIDASLILISCSTSTKALTRSIVSTSRLHVFQSLNDLGAARMALRDLPIEVLPEILQFVVKPQHLVSMCLANKTFRTFAVERLYERISIYSWHKEGKTKVARRSLFFWILTV